LRPSTTFRDVLVERHAELEGTVLELLAPTCRANPLSFIFLTTDHLGPMRPEPIPLGVLGVRLTTGPPGEAAAGTT
jgi:hypothetical protein